MKTGRNGKADLYCTSSTSPPDEKAKSPFSGALLKKAQEVWQKRLKRPLSEEEVEEAVRNLVGFGQALLEARQVSNPPKGNQP